MPQQNKDKRREYNRTYCRNRYINNKEYYLSRVKKRIQKLQKWYKDYKSTLKCSRCPENDPVCLDFHHNKGKKEELISRMIYVKGWGIERMIKEIEKCEVLCSNCHRKLLYVKGWGIERMIKEIEKCEVLCSNCHRKLHFGKKI